MSRIILVCGTLAGAIAISLVTLTTIVGDDTGSGSVWLGYVIMFASLSLVFAGIKRYRDVERGGVVRFWNAAGVGLGIALLSAIVYASGWEIYLWLTNYSFFPEYAKGAIEAKRVAGASAAEISKLTSEMTAIAESYTHLPYRMMMTSLEILPVGVLMSLISAALLRNPGFLPYRGAQAVDR